ncbi:MAG: 4Fe-4S binding protein [Deltaproteobacteria bacterium]|nr:4Fe-4S binding protein [Deltaproteobacteria bacterium]
MEALTDTPLVSTIKELCRLCYMCVRECPANAIRIKNGQAEVIEARCIGCGSCIKVCSQRAKQFQRSTDAVNAKLASGKLVAALAPSFPAEFSGLPATSIVGMIRALGFTKVFEVGFGADLLAVRYRQLLQNKTSALNRPNTSTSPTSSTGTLANPPPQWIGTLCPAIFGYVERYYPDLLPALAPLVSPMIAMARCIKKMHGSDVKVVFIGPCIAKKREALSHTVAGDVDYVLTFIELRELLDRYNITSENITPYEFDEPRAGKGTLLPFSGGFLEAAELDRGLIWDDVMAAEGRSTAFDAIDEFAKGSIEAKLLETLACKGCISGPGIIASDSLFSKQAAVGRYARERLTTFDSDAWRRAINEFNQLDLNRSFENFDQRLVDPTNDELNKILKRMGKNKIEDELNCGACGYDSCRAHARAVHAGLAEPEMCLPDTIEQLRHALGELDISHKQLANAQEELLRAEKLASMGQLAAGIAHEVNNPLAVILMYTHLLLDDCPVEYPMRPDLLMVVEQASRCQRIVSGLLNFSRHNKVLLQPTLLRDLVDRSARVLSAPDNITFEFIHDIAGEAEIDRDQITQVLMNLIKNAYDAMPNGGELTIRTGGDDEHVGFTVTDTGSGISAADMSKLFQPFFTTKPMGQGTGLGLSIAYGIVKMHRGEMKVESNCDPSRGSTGTTFTVTLPRYTQQL